MSPTTIERLVEKPGQNPFEGKLEPKDIKLSDAMATSAAALSAHMGKFDNSVQGLTRLHTLLGFEMGANMITDMQSVKKETLFWKVRWMSTCISTISMKHGHPILAVLFLISSFIVPSLAVHP